MKSLHGATTTQWLEDAGLTLRRLARLPEYERVEQGIYALPGARRDFWFAAAAALLQSGADARLTGASALFAHGLIDKSSRPIYLAVPEGKGSRKKAGFDVRRSSHLTPDPEYIADLAVAGVGYALSDYARDATNGLVARMMSKAIAFRRVTLDELTRVADERGRFPGSGRLRSVLRDFNDRETHSARERKLRRALARLGVVMLPEPYDVRDGRGTILGQADIAILDIRLDIEVDGPHHFLPEQQMADRRRDRAMKDPDWSVVRYDIYEIDEDVARVAADIAALIDRMRSRQAA